MIFLVDTITVRGQCMIDPKEDFKQDELVEDIVKYLTIEKYWLKEVNIIWNYSNLVDYDITLEVHNY